MWNFCCTNLNKTICIAIFLLHNLRCFQPQTLRHVVQKIIANSPGKYQTATKTNAALTSKTQNREQQLWGLARWHATSFLLVFPPCPNTWRAINLTGMWRRIGILAKWVSIMRTTQYRKPSSHYSPFHPASVSHKKFKQCGILHLRPD